MDSIKTNEREVAGKLAEWINERIKTGGGYPFTEASNETGIKIESKTRFGDIVIWKDREAKTAFSYIEIKPPFANKEDLESFREKAIKINVKYAFTWDFQTLNVYKVEKEKVTLYDTVPHPILNKLDECLRGDKQADIKAFINYLCDEIEKLNKTGKLSRFSPEKIYFINLIRDTKDRLIPAFERFIKEQERKGNNKTIIGAYVVRQGISYANDEAYYKTIASQRVYGLITKVIFYLTVRRYFKDLPDFTDTEEQDLNRVIREAFAKAAEKDWQAVFIEDPIEELGIPKDAELHLKKFFQELRVYHFADLKEDVIGELFEEIIDPNDRHSLGQYFTPEDLVDFVIATVVNEYNGFYADPTCGSGTFLIRLYDRLKYLRPQKKHAELLNQIWGIDIGKFPAELSTINLFRQEPQNFENFPRVLNKNIFDVRKDLQSEFPPPRAGINYTKVKVSLPDFAAFVGNFPYIRQELIEKKEKGFKDELTKLLAKEYLFTYSKLFEIKKGQEEQIEHLKNESEAKKEKHIDDWVDRKIVQLKLSGQADIYAYIFIHAATLLAQSGRFAIITSNSWLDVAYGGILKEFFLDNFNLKMVVASWAEPWFDDAAVNTIVTVLEKKGAEKQPEEPVCFVKLKKKFEELVPYRNLVIDKTKRWQKMDAIVREIETANYHKKCKKVTEQIRSYETDEMRIRLIAQSHLQKELAENHETSKWGKYLRAPDVYFELLETCKDKLVPLKQIADVRRGYTTGINEFFYLEPLRIVEEGEKKRLDMVSEPAATYLKAGNTVYCRNQRGWEGPIEAKFLRKIIKSPKEAESIIIDPDKLRYFIFICNKSKAELKKDGDSLALAYIEWGEKQKTKEGINWKNVPSVKSYTYWYSIEEDRPGYILLQMVNNERFASFLNQNRVLVDHNLFEFRIENDKYLDTAEKYLNSYVFALVKEVNSRSNLGDGATKTEGVDWKNLMLVPKVPLKIKFSNSRFFMREILPASKEIKQKDRKELDSAVLEAMGLNAKEWLPKIYEGLCEMVSERLELPKMRKKRKQDKEKFAYEEVKNSVMRDVVDGNLRNFPARFYEGKKEYKKLKFEQHFTTNKELKIEDFMGHYQVMDEDGDVVMETASEAKAKFLCVAIHYIHGVTVSMPEDERICEYIMKSYSNYVNDMLKAVTANANTKLHDISLAEKMAKEILAEKKLRYNFN